MLVRTLGLLIALLVATHASLASGVGAAFYQPSQVIQPASYYAPGCGSQVGCTQDCAACNRLGFACVDHATPAPCCAEGCCTPRRDSFGHYNTRWRRWPGDELDTTLSPEKATEGDPLLTPTDAPPPIEEDQQAPPSIEDSTADSAAGSDEAPQLEITLPPLPDVRPERVNPLPTREEPEAEGPFGAMPDELPVVAAEPEKVVEPIRVAQKPKHADDPPPPLPPSFGERPTRLPSATEDQPWQGYQSGPVFPRKG